MLIFEIEKLNSQFKLRENDYERAFDTHRRGEKGYS